MRDGFSQSLTAEGGPQADILQKLDFLDEAKAFEAGELSGAEMFAGLRAAIERGLEEGTITQQDVFDLGGGAIEDLTIPIFLEIDPLQVDEEFSQLDGRTVAAGVELFGGIDTAIEEARRVIETDLAESFSTAFDIPGKLQQLTEGLQSFSALIREGEDIPDAVEQAFQIEGFADFFRNVESLLGNILLGTLEIVAGILDLVGNTSAAEDVRGAIADQAERQLAFDVKFATDKDELSSAVSSAIRRGVDVEGIVTQIGTAVNELTDAGKFEEAAALIENLKSTEQLFTVDTSELKRLKGELEGLRGSAGVFGDLTGYGGDIDQQIQDIDTVLTLRESEAGASFGNKVVEDARKAIDEALTNGTLAEAFDIAKSIEAIDQGAAVTEMEDFLFGVFDEALASGNIDLASEVAGILGDSQLQQIIDEEVNSAFGTIKSNVTDIGMVLQPAVDLWNTAASDMGTATSDVSSNLQEMQASGQQSISKIQDATEQFSDRASSGIQSITDKVNALILALQQLGGVTPFIPGVPSATPTETPDTAPGAFLGGTRPAGAAFPVGERGAELVSFEEAAALIENLKSTEQLFTVDTSELKRLKGELEGLRGSAGVFGDLTGYGGDIDQQIQDIDTVLTLRESEAGASFGNKVVEDARKAIDEALTNGTLAEAFDIAKSIEAIDQGAAVTEMEDFLFGVFDEALASGNIDLASEVAGILGDSQLQQIIDEEVNSAFGTIKSNVTDIGMVLQPAVDLWNTAASDMGTATSDVSSNLQEMQASGQQSISKIQDATEQFSDRASSGIQSITDKVNALILALQQLGGVTPFIPGVPSATPTETPDTAPGAFLGGTRPAGAAFPVGERGAELVSFDEQVAILNNQTSERISAAVASVLGGIPQSQSVTDNRQSNQVNNVIIQSDAEGFATADAFANAVRTGAA